MPRTGRRHQIRAHLAASGFPILGDVAYAGDLSSYRLMLHAHRIAFTATRHHQRRGTAGGAPGAAPDGAAGGGEGGGTGEGKGGGKGRRARRRRKRLLLQQKEEDEGMGSSSRLPGAVVFPEEAVATAGDPFQGVVAWFDDDDHHNDGDDDSEAIGSGTIPPQ